MDSNPSTPTDQRWALAWTGWVIYFAVVERAAIKSGNRRAPLSFFLRHTLGVGRHPWHRRAGQVAAGGAFVWLVNHLAETPKD